MGRSKPLYGPVELEQPDRRAQPDRQRIPVFGSYGPEVFPETAGKIVIEWRLLGIAVVALPLFAAISALPPTLSAIFQDPADTLREEGP